VTNPSDFCVPLVALDAVVEIEGKAGHREVSLESFHRLCVGFRRGRDVAEATPPDIFGGARENRAKTRRPPAQDAPGKDEGRGVVANLRAIAPFLARLLEATKRILRRLAGDGAESKATKH
jgi:FAD binding domain in molybdopterin dehydrogenase